MDFTLKKYKQLLNTLQRNAYPIYRVTDFLDAHNEHDKLIILRHDVDKRPDNALAMAELESRFGIQSTYYFRTIETVFKRDVIEKINKMGHEVGYHYEVLARSNGDFKKAIELFEKEIQQLREIVPVETICMHGSPLSKWRDKDLWERYNFEDYDIKGDAFTSVDFGEISYFTDTGRRWDGDKFNIRDRVGSGQLWQVRTTDELILLFERGEVKRAMINVHPQRWNDNIGPWMRELIGQNIKNIGKWMLKKWR